ncbi:MAG: hypothetical protein QM499_04315 [Flavobacteriaceae bacterium]
MKTRWYFGTFIFLLSLFVVNQQQISIPNQEIVVQFSSDEVTLLETQNTIAIVKKQLQEAGVEKIKVQKGENGELKISYFSTIDIVSIKKILSEENDIDLGITSVFNKEKSNNSNKDSDSYKLDVYEIQKGDDLDLENNGFAVELKSNNDRFFSLEVYFINTEIDISKISKDEKVAYKIHRYLPVVKNNSLHIIPEVRAGPTVRLLT